MMQRLTWCAITDDQVLHDMFSAVLDVDDSEAVASDNSMILTGVGARTESQTVPTGNLKGDMTTSFHTASTSMSDSAFISHSRAMWIKTKNRFRREEQDALSEAKRRRATGVSFSRSNMSSKHVKESLIPFQTTVENPLVNAPVAEEESSGRSTSSSTTSPSDRHSQLSHQSSNSSLYRAASGTSMDAFCDEEEYDVNYRDVMEDSHYSPYSLPMICKYYAVLPRFWYRRYGEDPGAHITSLSRKLHLLWTALFLIGWIAIFFILMVSVRY